jgi:radical SAM protein with 4Fe4S-binding SPASM domain
MYALEDVAADGVAFRTAVRQALPYKPLYVKIKLVWTCNLRCGMCNHWREKQERPLHIDQFKAIVDELAELGCQKIHITGGEPTLYSDLVELIRHIREHDIRVNMTTNATLITKDKARALADAGLHRVNVSIDSPERKIHDKVRGVKGAWKKTTKGVGFLRRRLKKGQVCINTVVGRSNYQSLAGLPDLARDLGANQLNLIPLDEHTGDAFRLNKRQIKDYNAHVAPIIAEKGLAYGLIQDVREAYPFGLKSSEINLTKEGLYAQGYYEQNRCFAPWTHALIDHMGRVGVCCMLREKPIMGNLHEQSFKQVWEGENYIALRNSSSLPMFAECRQCDDFVGQNRRLGEILRVESGD